MRRPYIPKALRARVRVRDRFRCAYCHSQILVVASELEIEHVIPVSLGGPSTEDNLCLACSRCNRAKSDRIQAVDPITAQKVSLFNPVHDEWSQHFSWSKSAEHIIGLTAIGRATVKALNMNDLSVRNSRRLWKRAGWHPPVD